MANFNNANPERNAAYNDGGSFAYETSAHETYDPLLDQNWAYQPHEFFQHDANNMHDAHAASVHSAGPYTDYTNTPSAFRNTSYSSANAFATYPEVTPYNNNNSSTSHSLYAANPYPAQDPSPAGEFVQNQTITPGVLQTQSVAQIRHSAPASRAQTLDHATPNQPNPFPVLPKGSLSGDFIVTGFDVACRATGTRKFHSFLNIGDEPRDVTITKSTIPAYNPRYSRNDIKRLLATDSRLSAKLAKKSSKKTENSLAKPKTGGQSVRIPSTQSRISKSSQSPPSESSSEEDSDESEESEDDEPQPPLPATRPTTALGAIEYDTIKILWRAPALLITGDDIRTSLSKYWEIIKTIRDRWTSDSTALKQAEDAKKVHEIPLLQERVASQRTMLEMALKTAVEQGSMDIVEHCGENIPLMGCLNKFLFDRAKESDYSGTLARTILMFLSKCKTMTDGALEKTQLAKVLPRFSKRGDEGVKTMVKRITDNAIAASKKKKGTLKAGVAVQNDHSTTSVARKTVQPIAGVKRPLGGDTSSSGDQAAKRVAGNNGVAASTSASTKTVTAGKQMSGPVTAGKLGTTTAAPLKKVQQAAPSTTNFFSSLTSAAKKPGTSNAAIAAASQSRGNSSENTTDKRAAAQDKKPVPIKKETGLVEKKPTASTTAAAAPAFSFSSMMANLGKPKEEEPLTPKAEEVKIVETDEERKKRLHKEARRKLRVSWKPDTALEEVRFFTHDPEEDLGHDASQTRDVDDIKNEGRMFKTLQKRDKDMDENEEDEDADCSIKEESIKSRHVVKLIDFSAMDEDSKTGNFAPYGGGTQQPVCPEREMQEKREANTLLAVYSRLADVPSSPREPPADDLSLASQEVKPFGVPAEDVLRRLETASKQQAGSIDQTTTPALDLSAAINALNERPAQVQQPSQQSVAGLEAIFARFAAPQPQNTPQMPAPIPNFPSAPVQTPAQPPVPLPPSFPGISLTQGSTPDVSAILAALQQAQTPAVAAPPPIPAPVTSATPMPVPPANMDFSQFAPPPFMQMPPAFMQQMFQQMQQQQQQPNVQAQQSQSSGVYENEERKRWRELGGDDDDDDGNFHRRRKQAYNKPKDPNRPTPKFVVQCKYWGEGKCRKGANCTFLHT